MANAKLETATPKSSPADAPREVPFVIRAKGANKVVVTGDFNRWSEEGIALRKGPNGEWRTTLELRPGQYQYRLLIDGQWADDPQAVKRVPNPYGGQNCVLEVQGR